MIKGIIYALSACFIWGLIFIIPQFMEDFNSIEIALGRYTFYGLISSAIFLRAKIQGFCRHPPAIWLKATFFSLASTIVYYTSLVLALRYSNPAICALVLGISPITIAFYGNWKLKEVSYRNLVIPSLLILAGLTAINVPYLMNTDSASQYGLGLLFCSIALTSWSWYVVANSRFLKANPLVSSNDWATLTGVATLFWVLVCGLTLILFFDGVINVEKYMTWTPALVNFLLGCSALGILCSWLGSFLWNRASLYLPVSLAGQLTIFETIFGLIFVYALAGDLPPQLECLGVLLFLGAVAFGIRRSAQTPHLAN